MEFLKVCNILHIFTLKCAFILSIKVITGARMAGKPVFAMQLAQRADEGYAYAYVNFDDERLVGLKAGELDKLVEAVLQAYGCTRHLILDEIHNLDLDGGALRQQAPEAGGSC